MNKSRLFQVDLLVYYIINLNVFTGYNEFMTNSTTQKIYKFLAKYKRIITYPILLIVIIIFTQNFAVRLFQKPSSIKTTPELLICSLNTAIQIYKEKQKVYPDVFSDFIAVKGPVINKQTITLHNIQPQIEKINGIQSKKLTIVFKKGYSQKENPIATYYLNDSYVTADFKNF